MTRQSPAPAAAPTKLPTEGDLTHPVLSEFVAAALRAGATREATADALRQAGWAKEQIDDALRAYADVTFVIPVPRPRAQLSARDAFLYLVTFVALYLSAYHLGSLLFQFVNLAFPEPLELPEYVYPRIRWATSALVVAFPVYLLLTRRLVREVAADPTRRASAVRRWLIHLTLAGAALIVLGDLMALVHSLLSGELTVRFVLKCLIVGAIAGSVFAYYSWTVRTDDEALAR